MVDNAVEEKRKYVCERHPELVEMMIRIEDKLDVMGERQLTYIGKQERLEAIVTNGLSTTVSEMKKKLDTFCDTVTDRLNKIDSFSWFRNWMNSMRDHFFQNFIKLAVIGGALYLLIHFGDAIISKVLG